jgi:ABC-type multidrug transport system fused ATPase/permease subunit
VVEAEEAVKPDELQGRITFDGVSLQYQEGGPFAVQDAQLEIPAGKTVCIVGPTGCGKSTLLALLTRLYDPTAGTVRLDGTDIRRFPLRQLRRAVGNVLHDAQVFTGTVAENIAYGVGDAKPAEVEAVARVVDFHDFVAALPKGYETQLGKGGMALEKEELIKLNLARALMTRPVILTIDDTFASLEDAVEQRLLEATRRTLRQETVLIATSRLAACEQADWVVVMRKGRVVETGTHQELLAQAGLYRRMYMRQMGLTDAMLA